MEKSIVMMKKKEYNMVNNGYTIKRRCPKAKVLRESMLLVILVYTRGENSWYILSKLEKEQE